MAEPDNPYAAPPQQPAPVPGSWTPLHQPAQAATWGPAPAAHWGPPAAAQWGPPGWAPQGWVPQQASSTSGWAIAALVTGLLPLPPVAIGCGIVGIVKTRDGQQAGRGMAIAGVALGGAWLLFVAFVATIGAVFFFGGFDVEPRGPVSALPSTTVGTCLNETGGTWGIAECSARHDAEIYYVGRLEDADEISGDGPSFVSGFEADEQCMSAYEGYVGEDYYASDHEYAFFSPDDSEWAAGERRVVCVVTPGFADELRGTARG